MNWKLIVLGGLAFYLTTFILGFGTGIVIHDGVLKDDYKATSEFWRPELNQEPPDMGALMPYWITTGVISSLVIAGLFGWVRGCFHGPPWKQGLGFGIFLTLFVAVLLLSFSGFFNLPAKIWIWWVVDTLILYGIAGIVLGVVAQKVAPAG